MGNIIKYGENHEEVVKILSKMRDKFGDFNQIMVSVEELCELASISSKIPRYHSSIEAMDDIGSKVIDEIADVLIVMDHIIGISNVSEEDIINRINLKVERMKRWLDSGDDMIITTIDRKVE